MGTFNELYESVRRGELILIDGGICQYHIRKDGQLTIHVIISTRPGSGSKMFFLIKKIAKDRKAFSIVAKCPSDLDSNKWYEKKGFKKTETKKLPSGRSVNTWVIILRNGFFT